MLKLYTSPGACSMACHIALQESGVPFETKVISFEKGDLETPQMTKLNPKGYVPFLEIDSTKVLNEGTAILQYVAEQAPNANLMPTKGFERFKAIEWLNFIATECHKTFAGYFFGDDVFTTEEGRKDFKKFITENMTDKLTYINQSLEGKDYLMGSAYTVADSYLFTILNWSNMNKFDLSPFKNVVGFQNRVYARPATQRAMKTEGLLK